MISVDINDRHGPIGEHVDGLRARMNIAGKNQHIRAGMGNRKVFGEASGKGVEVHIRSNLDFHTLTNGSVAAGGRWDLRETHIALAASYITLSAAS
jgi:hypothetical protein